MEAVAILPHPLVSQPSACVWRLGWLTPGRCRALFVALMAWGFVNHLLYLTNDCPIDLSGDEAHYWDWSRQLDWSYYSKGPLVAYIIRASCAAFGDHMWAVRLPAVILGVGTATLTYLLTLKLFRSDRLALGAVLLNHIVPMFVAGSVLMTIDPPFFFCWALATYLAALAIFDEKHWAWPVIGIIVGVGFLAKYAMFLWLPTLWLVLRLDPLARRQLRSPGPWTAAAVASLFTLPVIVWNARHGWVSFRHVAKQTGTSSDGGFSPAHLVEFLAGQVAVIGPPLFVVMVAAALYALRRHKADASGPDARRMNFLLWVGLPFFLLTTLVTLRAKVQVNWPAPAYFTLLILGAYYLSTRLRDAQTWRPWRAWFYPAIVFGLLMLPIAHNMEIAYPAITWVDRNITRRFFGAELSPRRLDPTLKLRGWQELGDHVSAQLPRLGPGAFVLCEDYQFAGQMGFYVQGQPRTYYAGSYFQGAKRKRFSQYDMWPDRSLDPDRNRQLVGKDAVYVGYFKPDLWRAFEYIEELPKLDIVRRGVKIRQFRIYRCHNFKGMKRPADGKSY